MTWLMSRLSKWRCRIRSPLRTGVPSSKVVVRPRYGDAPNWSTPPCCTGAVARVPVFVWFALENIEELLVDIPSSVVPDVHYDPLLVPELVDLVAEAGE